MFKSYFVAVFLLLFMLCARAYDLNNPALSPVKHAAAPPRHAPLGFVEAGRLNFAILRDSSGEAHLPRGQASSKSIDAAVKALQLSFSKCFAQTPEIIEAADQAAREKFAYWLVVGDCALAREQGIQWRDIPEQGFVIKSFERGLFIVGHDTTLLEDRASLSRGSLYGAYDFSERVLGVRYFYPGDIGTYWPALSELEIRPLSYSDSPRFMNREGAYHLWLGLSKDEDLAKYGAWVQGLKKGDRSFGDALRFGAKYPGSSHSPRPEDMALAFPEQLETIFYTSAEGKFFYNPKQHLGNLFNVVDLKFADLLIEVWKAKINGDKMIGALPAEKFQLGARPNWISFGNCDTYQQEADIVNDPVVKSLNLITDLDRARPPRALMANVYARFYEYVCRRLAQELPQAQLCILAYYNAEYAPVDPRFKKMPGNIQVNLCNGTVPKYISVPEQRRAFQQEVRQWVESTGKPVHRLWLYDEYRNPYVRAVIGEFVHEVPKALGKDLGDGALFLDSGFQFPYYSSFYAAFRSMWNPDWDVQAGLDEHWALFYGEKAAPFLREFHQILKHELMDFYHSLAERKVAVPTYPAKAIQRLEDLLASAESSISPDSVEMRRFKVFSAPWAENIRVQKAAQSYKLPLYSAARLRPGETVNLDGLADEACWQRAAKVQFIDPNGGGQAPDYPIEAKLLWDEQGIYGFFHSPYPPLLDKTLWFNSGYELFLMPGDEAQQNYQFAFDAQNNQYFGKQRMLPLPGPVDPNHKVPGWQLKSRVDEQGWRLEFHLPYACFEEGPPKAGQTWRFNLVSNKLNLPKEVSASSLTLGNHHNYEKYGLIRFEK
ncbi:MAG: hypothetical protein WCS95_02155 [Lentisphaeria bacterium]|nr:DUF4838 domain-containing protein [Lentisphaeria bacterium]NLZ60111.1 DUF4838 domain-containing protein [Lentisphaerota bacterium]